MNLDALKQFDSKTANGILAAAALATAPYPGVGEKPHVLQAYERQVDAVLSEIRQRLKISPHDESTGARALLDEALADALRKSIVGDAEVADALSRVGQAGRLPPTMYEVVQT